MRGARNHRQMYFAPERRRALCRIQQEDEHLIPRDPTRTEILGLIAGIVIVVALLLLLKVAVG